MDAQGFDRITKSLAPRASRRRLVRTLAALGVGSGLRGPSRAGARRAPGGADGSGATIEATDPTCKGQPAYSNKVCPDLAECGGSGIDCECARSVSGSKKCVDFANARCPPVDQCDRNRDCGPGEVCIKVGACCGGSRKNLCLPSCV